MSKRDDYLEAMTDDEILDALRDPGNAPGNYDDYEFEEELGYRGYRNVNGSFVNYDESNPVALGIILALVLVAAILAIFGFAYAVSYAIYFSKVIYVAFLVGIVLVGRGKGRSKLANYIFFLICIALVTRLYPEFLLYVSYDQEFSEWLASDSTPFEEILIATFFYFVSILVFPWIFLKLIVMVARDNAKSRYPRYHGTHRNM